MQRVLLGLFNLDLFHDFLFDKLCDLCHFSFVGSPLELSDTFSLFAGMHGLERRV